MVDLGELGWQQSSLRRIVFKRDKSTEGDLWCWILSVLSLYDFITLIISLGFFYILSFVIVRLGGFNLISYIPGTGLQFLLIFCLGDLKHYLSHRFMHLLPFWELHKYHHSATEFNLITTSRGHFLERGILIFFDSLLFSLMGAPLAYFAVFLWIKEFYSQILHSNINWSLGWFGKYIFVSPKAHKLHHSKEPKFYGKNYGGIFIFWDKLFGTYAETSEPIKIGIQNNPYNRHGFWWDMFEGLLSFGRATGIFQSKK